jgi:hypothetical protein
VSSTLSKNKLNLTGTRINIAAIEHRLILRQARAAGSSLPSWLLPHAEQNKRFKSFVRLTRNVPMMSLSQLPADSQITDRSSRRRPASRRFRRYLVAICVGVAGTLAWQSYGEATKQIIAKGAPELGWSPEAKQMIATSIQWLGWTKPPAGPENIAPPETVANISKQPATPSLQQVQEIHADIAALRQTLERELAHMRETVMQLAASQELIGREIADLQATDQEILKTNAAPPPQLPAAAARKPIPVPPPPSSSRPATAPQ